MTTHQFSDEAILTEIAKCRDEHGTCTVRDLCSRFGFGLATMHAHLTRLRNKGELTWEDGRVGTIRVTPQVDA